jgi:anti-sigma regulatory factor (Ser/Thr protein kinase)
MKDRSFHVRVPVDARFLRAVRSFFQPLIEEVLGAEEAARLVLALDEACSNIVKHGCKERCRGDVTVEAVFGKDALRFSVRDFCADGDVDKIKPRDLADVRPGGLGTHFINEIMDRVAFDPEPERPGRRMLVMEKNVVRGKGAEA